MSLQSDALRDWLAASRSTNGAYRQLRLNEVPEMRVAALEELQRLAGEAHADAKNHWESLLGMSLNPIASDSGDRAEMPAYPDSLHTTTLQGYLGELLAGLIAENFRPHEIEWRVPAFLFSTHTVAVQSIERRRQLGGPARPIPGRTGDDALAFLVGEDGLISAWLWGEAKCTHDHNISLVHDGHAQLSTSIYLPVDLGQLIEILERRTDTDSHEWAARLRLLLLLDESAAPPRYDMFVYVCGRGPVRRTDWLSTSGPAAEYTGNRPLEAVEVHLTEDFDDVLVATYPAHVVNRD